MVEEPPIHSAMSAVYDMEIASADWLERVRVACATFAPSARMHLHLFESGKVATSFESVHERFTDEMVARLASDDVRARLSRAHVWSEHERLEHGQMAVDIEIKGARAVALVEDAHQLADTELSSVELFLHHWEVGFFLRELFGNIPDAGQPRDGLLKLMRSIREEAEEIRLSEEISEIWRGLMDGSWTLVHLDRNQSRWQFVVKENPETLEDPRALSRREGQVLRRAARGETNKLIAHDLELEESTIGSYLQRALAKLQLANRVELVSLRAALVAYENEKYRRTSGLREESMGVLDALDRVDRPESQVMLQNLRAMVSRMKRSG